MILSQNLVIYLYEMYIEKFCMWLYVYAHIMYVCTYIHMYLILFAYLLIGPLEKQQLITTHYLLIVMGLHILCKHHSMMQDASPWTQICSYMFLIPLLSCSAWEDQRSHQWDIIVIYQLVIAPCPETLHILDLMLITILPQKLQMLDTNMLTSFDCSCRK